MTRLFLADVSPLEDPAVYAELYAEASSVRKSAADSFRFAKDRRLSIGAAALLDVGLRSFGLREKDMAYGIGTYGKPFFLNAPEIHFSISHSSSKVAVAFSDGDVGCDIEAVTAADPDVAAHFFSNRELGKLDFFLLWTLKESYMKATGLGMSLPSKSFSILKGGNGDFRIEGEGAADKGFAFLTPASFDAYQCALCYRPEHGIPEVVRTRF